MELLLWVKLIGIAVTACIAAAVGTLTGFGSATILTPMMLLMMPLESAVVLVAIFHGANSLIKVSQFWKRWDSSVVTRFGLVSVLFAVPGAWMLGRLPTTWLMIALGLFLVLYGAVGVSDKMRGYFVPISTHPIFGRPVFGGMLSGLMAGAIGTGGAIRSFFLHNMGLKKESYIATGACIALLVDMARLSTYGVGGAFQALTEQNSEAVPLGWIVGVTVVSAFFGVFLGKKVLKKMKPENFDQSMYWSLMIIGIYFVEKSIRHLM